MWAESYRDSFARDKSRALCVLAKYSTIKLDPTILGQNLKNKVKTFIISMKYILVTFLVVGKKKKLTKET